MFYHHRRHHASLSGLRLKPSTVQKCRIVSAWRSKFESHPGKAGNQVSPNLEQLVVVVSLSSSFVGQGGIIILAYSLLPVRAAVLSFKLHQGARISRFSGSGQVVVACPLSRRFGDCVSRLEVERWKLWDPEGGKITEHTHSNEVQRK